MSVLMAGQERDRALVDRKYTWNLADIFPSEALWRAEKQRIAAALPDVRAFAGRLGSTPAVLAEALELTSRLDKELSRLYVYASMLSDEATTPGMPNFTGAFVGMACQDMSGAGDHADFDWFEYVERPYRVDPFGRAQ